MDLTPDHNFCCMSDLLADKLPDGPLTVIALRVSAHSAKELKENVQTAVKKLYFLPAAVYLGTLDLVALLQDKSADGEHLRHSVGMIPIRRANAHRWALKPKRLMGHALPVPDEATVILMLFDSAADPSVKSPDEPLPGNAVCALLSQVCLMPQVHRLYVPEWSRWVRDPRYGATVRSAAQMGAVDVYEGANHIDITSTTGAMIAGVKDGEASGERDKIRKRTMAGTLAKLTADRVIWPYAKSLLPPAYELEYDRQQVTDGKSQRVAYVQEATGEQAEGWQQWAETIAAGGTYLATGKYLAAKRVPARGTRHANPDGTGKTYAQLTEVQLERASYSLAQHVRTLRHRKYTIRKDVPVAVRRGETFEGYDVDHDDPGRYNYGTINEVVDLPAHCINLPQHKWDAWERRIHNRTPRDTLTDGPRAPFADVRQQWFVTATSERRQETDKDWTHNLRIVANGDSYEVFRRTRAEAINARGELRGWENREGKHLYTMRRSELDRLYACAGIEASLRHIGDFEPVVIEQRPLPDPAEQERHRAERLTKLADLIVAARDAVDDAKLLHESAMQRGRGIEEAATKLDSARTALQELTTERDTLLEGPAPEPTTVSTRTVSVDIGTPARLFGVLAGAAGHRMPRAVSDVLHRLSAGRINVEPDPGLPRMLRVTDTLDWPADDGTVVPLRITFPVENRKRDLDKIAREKARRESAAALILRDGYTVDAAAELLDGTRAETVTRVRAWLKDHHTVNLPTRGTRSSIVDCPLREPKRAVWNALTGDASSDGDERFRQLVVARYLAQVSHANSWVGRDVTLDRQVFSVITALLGQGVDLDGGLRADDIAARAGCTPQHVMYLCDGPNNKYRGVLERVPSPGRRVRPRRCQAGHWLLHVLPTLETEQWSGLLCTTCRGTPDGIPLPAGYFELWNGPSVQHDLAAAPGTTLAEAPIPVAPGVRPRLILNIGEAAAYLQVSTSALREWSNAGLVACEQRPRRYDQRVLDSSAVRALVERYHATYGQRTADDDRLTLAQVSERLGVAEHYVRDFLIDTGKLAASRGGSRGITLLFEAADVDAVPREWCDQHAADLVNIGAAAKRLGMTVCELRAAAAAGRVPSLVTDGGTRRFRPTDIDAHRHSAARRVGNASRPDDERSPKAA